MDGGPVQGSRQRFKETGGGPWRKRTDHRLELRSVRDGVPLALPLGRKRRPRQGFPVVGWGSKIRQVAQGEEHRVAGRLELPC